MGDSELSDDLEGSLIHIFQHPSAAESTSGVVDDIFADIVQSSDDVDEVGVLDLSPELIGIDQWTMATDVTESSHRSGCSSERNYSEADLTRSTTLNLKAGATVTAFGDQWGSFGGSSSSADDEVRWLKVEDDEVSN
jgi:hypothetical protein